MIRRLPAFSSSPFLRAAAECYFAVTADVTLSAAATPVTQ
jgi:hypothetical protein